MRSGTALSEFIVAWHHTSAFRCAGDPRKVDGHECRPLRRAVRYQTDESRICSYDRLSEDPAFLSS
jgi:hypothetical protein